MEDRLVSPKIMIVRHAEKPNEVDSGVSPSGKPGKQHLSPRGWQRAGALANLFAPPPGIPIKPQLAVPQHLFASAKDPSRRSLQTLVPLSEKLSVPINPGVKGDEASLVEQVTSLDGVVLIAWQRERIPAIAEGLLRGSADAARYPRVWPPDCFDVIWVFDFSRESNTYRFRQVPQQLLSGDREAGIPEHQIPKVRVSALHRLRAFRQFWHPEISRR